MDDKGRDIMDAFRGRPARPNPGSSDDGVTEIVTEPVPNTKTNHVTKPVRRGETHAAWLAGKLIVTDMLTERGYKPGSRCIWYVEPGRTELIRMIRTKLEERFPELHQRISDSLVADYILALGLQALSDREGDTNG